MAEQYGNAAVITALSAPDKLGDMAGKVADYLPNEHTRYDMPSLFVAAVGYEFTPSLRAATEFHFFDDKNAKMGGQRQEKLSHGTYEVLAGVEWDINKKFTVSCGGQRTDYGLTDDYQQNTSFACDSWSLGLGGAWNINEKIRLNASYFCSLYSDYNKTLNNAYSTPYTVDKTYSRTNHVIGVGVDYKF
jgi:long-chain fatty acid transport protein